ncbi:MAG: ADP-ribosylglycohydrolase family protein [bacterium]
MVNNLVDRARGALLGLAAGDALGSPTEGKSPDFIKSQWGRVADFLSEAQAGTDDTEYALFSAKLILEYGRALTSELVARAWQEHIIAASNEYKGAGFSEILTIANLRKGLMPPQSGQHLHSWSDGLAMRVAPYGIVAAGDPKLAAQLAEIDGAVSHSGEGIYSGKAVAAAVAAAAGGASLQDIIMAAHAVIPANSWTARAIAMGVKIGGQSEEVWSALQPLYERIACAYYHWADLAPEAVGLAFGILTAAQGKFEEAVLGSVNVGRDADTIAAICGAITGASAGEKKIPASWLARITIAKGNCIKTVKGMNISEVAEKLAELAKSWSALT